MQQRRTTQINSSHNQLAAVGPHKATNADAVAFLETKIGAQLLGGLNNFSLGSDHFRQIQLEPAYSLAIRLALAEVLRAKSRTE
jgi:hypothetical protein